MHFLKVYPEEVLGNYNPIKTLERAVEMGQKRNMVKAMMEGTEETRTAGNCSSSSSARVVRWAK